MFFLLAHHLVERWVAHDSFPRHCFESSRRLQPNQGTSKELMLNGLLQLTIQQTMMTEAYMIKQVCGLRAKTPHLHFKCRVPSCSPKQFETGETWHVASGQAGIGKAMANLHENEIKASCSQNEYVFRIKSKVNPENTSKQMNKSEGENHWEPCLQSLGITCFCCLEEKTFEFQCSNFCLAKSPPTCRSAQLHLRKLSLQRSSWGFFTGSCWTTGNTTNTHRLWTFRRGVVDVKNIGERTQWHT